MTNRPLAPKPPPPSTGADEPREELAKIGREIIEDAIQVLDKKKPPPAKRPPSPGPAPASGSGAPLGDMVITRGVVTGAGQRIVLYGDAGAGKTTLASVLPVPVFIDVERSTQELDTARVECHSYNEVRTRLANPALDEFKSVNLDSGSVLQTFAHQHVLATIPSEGGKTCNSIEDYGWGKGYRHIYDQFALVLADLDRRAEMGQHVCLICHAEATQAPNPQGPDWLRWEPQLQSIKNSNIRSLVLQWAGHVLFLGKDVAVDKGKGIGGTTRTLHVTDQATMLAKSRRLRDPIPVSEGDPATWTQLLS